MPNENQLKMLIEEYNSLTLNDFSDLSISRLFQLIIDIVNHFLRKSRSGILLGLIEMGYNKGSFIGGFHKIGTNEIYLNKSALRIMRDESSIDYYKAYLFYLLLHEYIHSLGIYDEIKTRQLTQTISLSLFKSHHPIGKLSIFGLNYLFPYSFRQKRYQPHPKELGNPKFVLLRHRDSELTYI